MSSHLKYGHCSKISFHKHVVQDRKVSFAMPSDFTLPARGAERYV